MAVCIYTQAYGDVARSVIGKTLVQATIYGFHSSRTARVFNQGSKCLEEMWSFGKVVETERNLFWKSAVNYLGRKIGESTFPLDWYKT